MYGYIMMQGHQNIKNTYDAVNIVRTKTNYNKLYV